MKYELHSFKTGIDKSAGKNLEGKILSKEETQQLVEEYISQQRAIEMDNGMPKKEIRTKEDMRRDKKIVLEWIKNCLEINNVRVANCSDKTDITNFIRDLVSEYAGYSILEDAFEDPEISDIYCISWDTIFVEKNGQNIKYWRKFTSPEHYKRVIQRLLQLAGKEINVGENKVTDFEICGDRGCATSSAVSPLSPSLTLRKHAEEHIILDQLLESEVINEEMNRFFGLIIDGEMNFILAGITGSGKTTTLRSLIDHYVTKNGRRMLVCEDTQELFPKNEHTLQLVSTPKNDKNPVTLENLVLTALRLKPKYIVIGEVRGPEAQAAVEAMETGHSTLFSMHSDTSINVINRLVDKYLTAMPSLGTDVVERIIGSAVDYIAIQDNIMGIGRRITSIDEVDYDYDKGRVRLTPIFEFSFELNDFVMVNRLSKSKVTRMMRRGVRIDDIRDLIRTDNEETEKTVIANINKKYQAEKQQRMQRYEERKAQRIKLQEESISNTQNSKTQTKAIEEIAFVNRAINSEIDEIIAGE